MTRAELKKRLIDRIMVCLDMADQLENGNAEDIHATKTRSHLEEALHDAEDIDSTEPEEELDGDTLEQHQKFEGRQGNFV